jgi:alkylation response protein AidB-like acyl-CoA dehydrogenase
MPFTLTLTPEQEEIRDLARDFAEREIAPRAAAIEDSAEFPRDIVRQMGELGFLGLTTPEEYGGTGLGYVCYTLVSAEIARASMGVSMNVGLHNSLVAPPLRAYGTDEQRRRYLPDLVTGKTIGCFALSEPGAGSDAGHVETTAVPDGGGGFVINGTKVFITNGSVADFVICYAATDRSKGPRGMTAFLLDMSTPGIAVGTIEKKMGIMSSPTTELIFQDVKAPASSILGSVGEGFKIAMSTLDGGRIGVGSQAVGVATAAFEAGVRYARQREAFGGPIARFQAIRMMMADMRRWLTASRALVMRAAWLKDAGRPVTLEAAQAKLYATECATRITHRAGQIHGGYGYIADYPVERYYRDVRVAELFEGTSEIQRLVIAARLLDLKKN